MRKLSCRLESALADVGRPATIKLMTKIGDDPDEPILQVVETGPAVDLVRS